LSVATFIACRLILQSALEAARRTLAQQALAFSVSNAIHGRATAVATVRSRGARRFSHRLIAAGPIAKNFGVIFSRVTTRGLAGGGRRSAACLRRLGFDCLPLASLTFCLVVLAAAFVASAAFLLTLGRMPAL